MKDWAESGAMAYRGGDAIVRFRPNAVFLTLAEEGQTIPLHALSWLEAERLGLLLLKASRQSRDAAVEEHQEALLHEFVRGFIAADTKRASS